jgi:dienelactone hydrolase
MTIQTRLLEYTHNNVVLEGLLAWDDALAGPQPAVAVSHAWAGRNAFEDNKAIELAKSGYIGFALDMYGKGVLGASVEENTALMTPFMQDRVMLQKRIGAAFALLREQPEVNAAKVAAMGFCFGGLCVLDLARSGSDVSGVISFHGLLGAPDNTGGNSISAKILCLHGYDDPMALPQSMLELASELTAAGADWQVHAYGNTMHAFTNPAANDAGMGTMYNEVADRRSQQALENFLQEIFTG